MRQIIFDTETTGLRPRGGDRLVEIGAIEMVNGAITGAQFHVHINPERDMPEEAYAIHKLSGDFLSDKPVFADEKVGPAFLDFIKDAGLIAHNAEFDLGFIEAELDRAGLPALANEVIDTLKLARKKFPGAPASLDALCARFGIDTTQRARDGHGALLDSRLLAEVYIELTGGAQGGLQLSSVSSSRHSAQSPKAPLATLRRDGSRPRLLTDDEKEAHAAFIAEMDTPIWHKMDG